jgi:deoxyuridine 5'-triphosphate nucleotidohydrolase
MSTEIKDTAIDLAFGKKRSQYDADSTAVCKRPKLFVKKLSLQATLPTRGSSGAAGYDLSAAKDCVVAARGKALVPTDLSINIPDGCYARIAPRSGLAWKNSIDVGAGVVDFDYRTIQLQYYIYLNYQYTTIH